MTRQRLIGTTLALALVLGLGAALVGGALPLPGRGDAKGGKPEVALEFGRDEVVQPRHASMPQPLEFSGALVAPASAVLRAKAAGTLLTLSVREGDRVRAGQLLGRIDTAEADSRAAEREAQLGAARAALAQAERTHASNERLAAQQFISPVALEQSRAGLNTARAQLDAAQAALNTARLSLRDATLSAPIDGIVAERKALPGEKVSPEQPVLTIVDLRELELAGRVGTHEVARLAPGLPVQVQVEGLAEPVAGRIARIAPAADPGTRAIGVAVVLPNPAERLRAGQFALARVTLDDRVERLTLPAGSLVDAAGQPHVWLIEDGVLARRAVTVGRRDAAGGRVELLSGVTPASVVLAARYENLREGAKALVSDAPGASVAATRASGARPASAH
ncbi:MAG: efflux RND transporter periplasmic adaptor subunit [Burkholderiales bacterium]|nr:efflux RND transporter periplasmic adaptor subunit [Burkholderiales bacterium]